MSAVEGTSVLLTATDVHRVHRLPRAAWSMPWAQPGTHAALRGVSLRLHHGERLGLVGTSGSGKSTLLRCLLALDTPDSGEVRCDGRPVATGSARSLRWFRRRVQYVPQDPASTLDPRMTVADLVAEPLRHLQVPGDRTAAVTTALARVGLDPQLASRRPGELSGGQAQRVAIARALAPGPVALLADEPVSGLDLLVREQVVGVLADLSALEGLALLLVSHDLSVVSALCSRTVVLDAGLVVEDRPTADLMVSPSHPRTRALVDAVPRLPA